MGYSKEWGIARSGVKQGMCNSMGWGYSRGCVITWDGLLKVCYVVVLVYMSMLGFPSQMKDNSYIQ